MRIWWILTIGLILAGCKATHEPGNLEAASGGPLGQGASFAELNVAVFAPYCVRCHQHYSQFSALRREIQAIGASVNANRMPKISGPLPLRLKELLNQWILKGAPEFADSAPEPSVPVSLEPNWDSISSGLFQPKCVVCHNPSGSAKFVDLSTRTGVLGLPDKYILLKVMSDKVEPMPPIWSSIQSVSGEDQKVVQRWIELNFP